MRRALRAIALGYFAPAMMMLILEYRHGFHFYSVGGCLGTGFAGIAILLFISSFFVSKSRGLTSSNAVHSGPELTPDMKRSKTREYAFGILANAVIVTVVGCLTTAAGSDRRYMCIFWGISSSLIGLWFFFTTYRKIGAK